MKAENRIFPRSCVALARKVAGCLEPKMAPPQKLCGSRQEGGQLSGAEDGAASEALWLSPGRSPVVWSRRWRRLRSSVALACTRNCWPLYSTPSPVQPALLGVPEPRWLPPEPEAETSQAGRIPVLSPGRWPVVSLPEFLSPCLKVPPSFLAFALGHQLFIKTNQKVRKGVFTKH